MRFRTFFVIWIMFSAGITYGGFEAYDSYRTRKFTMSDAEFNFVVYDRMPEEKLSEKLDANISESTAGFTDNNGTIWLEASAARNRSEFHDFCDHEVAHNRLWIMNHEWIYSSSGELDFDVCDRVTARAASRGWL